MADAGARIVEVKRNLDGTVLEFVCAPLLVEAARAIVRCDLDSPETVAGGAIVLPAGTRSYGYFWLDRPYTVYHWLHGGATLAWYVNVGRVRSIGSEAVVWDDYAVDVLARPDGSVAVLDEDEVPEGTPAAILDVIEAATARVLGELEAIVELVERETCALEAGSGAG